MVAELLRHGECKTRAYNSGPWLSPDQGIGGEGGGLKPSEAESYLALSGPKEA